MYIRTLSSCSVIQAHPHALIGLEFLRRYRDKTALPPVPFHHFFLVADEFNERITKGLVLDMESGGLYRHVHAPYYVPMVYRTQ